MDIDRYLSYLRYASLLFIKNWDHPIYTILYVTDRCNCRCKHCFYWSRLNKKQAELSLDNARMLATSLNPCLHLVLTGGEPFLRDDLPRLVEIFDKYAHAEIVSIPTNGSLPSKIEADVREILVRTKKQINITVSIDGLKKTHDKIRNLEGVFESSLDTLNRLCKLKKKFRNLNVGVISTIHKANKHELRQLFDYIHPRYDINQFQVNLLRGNARACSVDQETIECYKELRNYTYNVLRRKNSVYNIALGKVYTLINKSYHDLIVDTVEKNGYITPCYAANLNGVIYSNLDVFACEIRPDLKLGNLKEVGYDIRKIWKSDKSRKIRKNIISSKCFCTFECQLTTNVVFNPLYILGHL